MVVRGRMRYFQVGRPVTSGQFLSGVRRMHNGFAWRLTYGDVRSPAENPVWKMMQSVWFMPIFDVFEGKLEHIRSRLR